MTTSLERVRTTRTPHPLAAGIVTIALLSTVITASVLIGSRPVSPTELGELLSGHASSDIRTLVLDVRIPRTLAGLTVGIALAWAGTLMQAMTRNPLADPGLLGVSSGAAFAVTIGMSWLGISSAAEIATTAIIGAATVTAIVLVFGLRRTSDPSRLILAGVAFSMTVAGIQSAITLLNPRALDAMRAWTAGSLASPDTDVIAFTLPVLVAGVLLSLLLTRALDALALGDDLARSLGSRPLATRIGTGLATACLVGGATAVAGPIAFIGLMVPHIIRPFTGPGTARILLIAAPTGATLVLTADILARVILWPGELPVGVVCAALGATMLLTLARARRP